MAALSISETQFAFTYFHKFSLLNKKSIYQFVFPSLQDEGKPLSGFGGADLVICKNIFIQFKVPEYLVTAGTKEFYAGNAADLFTPPFFRIRIKNKLLGKKRNSGQYQMLQAAARNGKSAEYIFPLFNSDLESDDRENSKYWFDNFFRMSPALSLSSYCLSVNFADMISSAFDLDNSDTHTLCTDYETGMKDGDVYVFSQAKHAKASNFNSFSYYYQNEILSWVEEENKTFEQTLTELVEIFELEDANIENLYVLQRHLLHYYDIFWMPILKSKKYEIYY